MPFNNNPLFLSTIQDGDRQRIYALARQLKHYYRLQRYGDMCFVMCRKCDKRIGAWDGRRWHWHRGTLHKKYGIQSRKCPGCRTWSDIDGTTQILTTIIVEGMLGEGGTMVIAFDMMGERDSL